MTPEFDAGSHAAAQRHALLSQLRRARPLVQVITNYVSMDLAANALLAIGAAPAMIHAPEEAADFSRVADAVVVNIGTLSKTFLDGMIEAATAARETGKPWVLDPVGAGATRYRNEAVASLLAREPTIIRGNASEIIAVAQIAGCTRRAGRPRARRQRASTAPTKPRPPGSRRWHWRGACAAWSPRPARSISSPTANASRALPTAPR